MFSIGQLFLGTYEIINCIFECFKKDLGLKRVGNEYGVTRAPDISFIRNITERLECNLKMCNNLCGNPETHQMIKESLRLLCLDCQYMKLSLTQSKSMIHQNEKNMQEAMSQEIKPIVVQTIKQKLYQEIKSMKASENQQIPLREVIQKILQSVEQTVYEEVKPRLLQLTAESLRESKEEIQSLVHRLTELRKNMSLHWYEPIEKCALRNIKKCIFHILKSGVGPVVDEALMEAVNQLACETECKKEMKEVIRVLDHQSGGVGMFFGRHDVILHMSNLVFNITERLIDQEIEQAIEQAIDQAREQAIRYQARRNLEIDQKIEQTGGDQEIREQKIMLRAIREHAAIDQKTDQVIEQLIDRATIDKIRKD